MRTSKAEGFDSCNQPSNLTQIGYKSSILLEIRRMTPKNNGAPLLYYIKLCASFQSHWWIQTGVTVWKRLNWVLTSVTLTFDIWPWPFAWASLLSMVITPENFMMIWWLEHCQKGVTDRQADRCTEPFIELLGRSKKSSYRLQSIIVWGVRLKWKGTSIDKSQHGYQGDISISCLLVGRE